MSKIILSSLACPPLLDYLRAQGHTLELLPPDPRYGPGVETHADLRACQMAPGGPVLRRSAPPPSPAYPGNASMCAAVLEGFLIHRLDITAPHVLQYCLDRRFRPVNVRQGYARCACVVVDGKSLITADPGLLRALRDIPELEVLAISPGRVLLPGYDTGFLGGVSGRVGKEVLFNGDLSVHPDFPAIRAFIESRGLTVRYFPGHPLTDIGSILEEP